MASSTLVFNPNVKPPEKSDEKELKETPMPADDQSFEESNEKDLEKQPSNSTKVVSKPEGSEDGPAYPPTREVIIIMPALYLAMFLQALVSSANHKRESLYDFFE